MDAQMNQPRRLKCLWSRRIRSKSFEAETTTAPRRNFLRFPTPRTSRGSVRTIQHPRDSTDEAGPIRWNHKGENRGDRNEFTNMV